MGDLIVLVVFIVGGVLCLWNTWKLPVENPSGKQKSRRCHVCGCESKEAGQ